MRLLTLAFLAVAAPFVAVADPFDDARALCAERWSGDYEMQLYCYQQQEAAMLKVAPVFETKGTPAYEAVMLCMGRWQEAPKRFDWAMVAYCAEGQLEAREALRSLEE